MKYLLLALLVPSLVLAQTPTPSESPLPSPTIDPDIELAERFNMTVLDVKMQKIQQIIGEVRNLKRADTLGKIGTSEDVVFDLTAEQKQQIRQARRAKIQAMRQLCRDLSDNL